MDSIDNTAPLTGYEAISFDWYGTLIEWEPNLLQVLEPLIKLLSADHAYAADPKLALLRHAELANEIEHSDPTRRYDRILVDSVKEIAAELVVDESKVTAAEFEAMATGPGRWPPFVDTIEALKALKKHYKLVILSNVNNANMQRTVCGPLGEVEWDAVHTAEDIGSYKPSPKNFEHLFRRARDDVGADVEKGELLYVARSLKLDHSAAKALGFKSCWIARGGDTKDGQGVGGDFERMIREGEISFQWKFDTLGDFAKEVERQFESGSHDE